MAAFTIFFCGTGSNSFDFAHANYFEGELVSTLAMHHEGHEFADWIIVDGPGSGNLQEAQKWVPSGNYSKIRGTLTGKGWDENVAHAVAVLKGTEFEHRDSHTRKEKRILRNAGVGVEQTERTGKVARKLLGRTKSVHHDLRPRISPQMLQQKKREILGKPITHVNVIGWSRGGVTCHMFANALAETEGWSHIPVNIFAADPVPGLGNFQSKRTLLGANVRTYVGVFATDEHSLGFSPAVPMLHHSTRRFLTTMPGRHATLVGNAAIDGSKGMQTFFAPGRVTRDLAEKFLTDWGTPLKKRLDLSLDQILELYDEILQQMPWMRKFMRGESYTVNRPKWWTNQRVLGVGPLPFSFDLNEIFRTDEVFANSHHRWAFAQRYPGAYHDLFVRPASIKGNFARTLQEIDRRFPALGRKLQQYDF